MFFLTKMVLCKKSSSGIPLQSSITAYNAPSFYANEGKYKNLEYHSLCNCIIISFGEQIFYYYVRIN